jgi:hypothetical protein
VGDGTTTDRLFPAQVGTGTDWVALSAGTDYSLALKADGSLCAWGDNSDGQLGDGTTTDELSPVEVLTVIRVPATTTTTSTTTTTTRTTTTTTVSSATTTTLPSGPSFFDTVSSPYQTAIESLAAAGIVTGYQDGTFRPDNSVTRQQFAKMIVLTGGYSVSESDVCHFTDVAKNASSLYPDNYVAVAAAHYITTGTTSTHFSPMKHITRYQVISMVVRTADDVQPGLLVAPPATWAGNATWAKNATHGANAARAEYNGLLAGLDLTALNPNGDMDRGEVAQVLYNLLGKLRTTTSSSAPNTTEATTF